SESANIRGSESFRGFTASEPQKASEASLLQDL
ncbi:hypothetical protein A2U01_0092344, partial [Trifolium medium]|nr:hypothetical protein [Trifolium medium]